MSTRHRATLLERCGHESVHYTHTTLPTGPAMTVCSRLWCDHDDMTTASLMLLLLHCDDFIRSFGTQNNPCTSGVHNVSGATRGCTVVAVLVVALAQELLMLLLLQLLLTMCKGSTEPASQPAAVEQNSTSRDFIDLYTLARGALIESSNTPRAEPRTAPRAHTHIHTRTYTHTHPTKDRRMWTNTHACAQVYMIMLFFWGRQHKAEWRNNVGFVCRISRCVIGFLLFNQPPPADKA